MGVELSSELSFDVPECTGDIMILIKTDAFSKHYVHDWYGS